VLDAFKSFECLAREVALDSFARDSVRVFKALGDPTRYEMLCMLLREGTVSSGRFQEVFRLSAPTLSHHAKVLEGVGLVESIRERQSVIYRVNRDRLRQFLPGFERVHAVGE